MAEPEPVPWPFQTHRAADPRVLNAIQAQGFRAASELLDRLLDTLGNDRRDPRSGADDAGRAEPDPAGPAGPADPFLQLWWATVGRLLRSPTAGWPSRRDTAIFALPQRVCSGRVILSGADPDAGGAAGWAHGEVWVHNDGSTDLPDVQLTCSELCAHDGSRIPAHQISVAPPRMTLPARSNRAVRISVPTTGFPRGRYHGTVFAVGYPELWLPAQLLS